MKRWSARVALRQTLLLKCMDPSVREAGWLVQPNGCCEQSSWAVMSAFLARHGCRMFALVLPPPPQGRVAICGPYLCALVALLVQVPGQV